MSAAPQHDGWERAARAVFEGAPFVTHLGTRLDALAPGRVDASLAVEPRHLQQSGVVHAGVMATLADHAAGTAAITLAPAGYGVVSIEFKVNLLRGATGPRLRCVAEVLRPGRSVTVVEAWVYDQRDGREALASKATVTLALIAPSP
ncbi:MAG: PaaI family thioesterase [Polyangiales bacterium]